VSAFSALNQIVATRCVKSGPHLEGLLHKNVNYRKQIVR